MKKLLALLLCVMLFVSVVPASAFADGIDISPAYLAMKDLNGAYGRLAAATVAQNNLNMGEDLIASMIPSIAKYAPAIMRAQGMDEEEIAENLSMMSAFPKMAVRDLGGAKYPQFIGSDGEGSFISLFPSGISYEKLFEVLGGIATGEIPGAGGIYLAIANYVGVASAAIATAGTTLDVYSGVNNILGEFGVDPIDLSGLELPSVFGD